MLSKLFTTHGLGPQPEGPWLIETWLQQFERLFEPPELRLAPIDWYIKWLYEHGDIYRTPLQPKTFVISSATYAEHILKTNRDNYPRIGPAYKRLALLFGKSSVVTYGEKWQVARKHLQPGFSSKLQKQYSQIISDEVLPQLLREWLSYSHRKKTINITDETNRIGLWVAAACLFSRRLKLKDEKLIHRSCKHGNRHLATHIILGKYTPSLHHQLFRYRLYKIHTLFKQLMAERHTCNTPPEDILTVITENYIPSVRNLNPQEQLNEMKVLLITGHLTVGSAMAWFWYEMTRNPQCYQDLQVELDTHLSGRIPTLDDLPQLSYCNAVVKEVLRLYPPIWCVQRKSIAADKLGPYYIPAKSSLHVNIFSLHRNPDLWPQPNTFQPERFLSPDIAKMSKFAWIPFGVGANLCLGMQFAMNELQLVIATLAQHINLDPTVTPTNIKPNPFLTLSPPTKLPIKLITRKKYNKDQAP